MVVWTKARKLVRGIYNAMMDLMFIGITITFFSIAVGYVRACEKLR